MDDKVFTLINDRMSRIETKVDQLLEFKWKVIGLAIAVGVIAGGVFELFTALIQSKGG